MRMDIPAIKSRNMGVLMQGVVESHQGIHEAIRKHAQEAQAARDALNEKQNADNKVGYKTVRGS